MRSDRSSESLGGRHPCRNNGAETLIIITPNRTDWDDMEALEANKTVKSGRKYKPDPIPEQKVQAVMNATRFAHADETLQPGKFIADSDADKKRKPAAA